MSQKDNIKPVRILQIGMTRNIGGLETYLMQQFDHLDKTKVMYDFVNITDEYDMVFQEKIEQAGGRVYGVKSRHSNPLRHYWQWIRLLARIHRDYKGIVLNSNGLTYVFPLVAAKWFGIPLRVIHSHNAGFETRIGILKKLILALNRVLLRHSATTYFACSQKAGEWMFGKNHAFTVIHNAIETERFAYRPEVRDRVRQVLGLTDQFVIGHVGRFSYQKNHAFLLDIFRAFHEKHPRSVLLLVGGAQGNEPFMKEAREKAASYGLTEAVKFLGMRTDVPDLMQAMDSFVLPSHFEGLPVVGMEAQAAGLPCFFADTITKEAGITKLAHFISLESGAAHWAEEIQRSMGEVRQPVEKEIAEAGYDIRQEMPKLESFYFSGDSLK